MSQPDSDGGRRGGRLRTGLLVTSFALLLLVGLSLPNAAASDLGDRGWAPGTLLPFTLGPALVTVAMWTAYTLGAAAVVLSLARRDGELPRAVVGVLAVAAALTTPFGSGDHVSYAAYGRILSLGDNPWLESPQGWRGGTDPVVSRVEAPWTEEPSVYGPFATLVQGFTSLGGGDNLRETVWLWQLVVVASWLAVRWCLRRLLPGRAARIDAVWTANPLVFSVGVLGAHVDLLATALGVAAVWAAHRWVGTGGAVLAGALAGLALSSKFTYAVFVLALLLALGARRLGRVAAVVLSAAVVTGALHLWAGPHVYEQLGRSARAVSLASPWRWLLEVSGGGVGVRMAISVLAALMALVFAVCLARLVRPRLGPPSAPDVGPSALAWVVVLAGGYALAASYSLPWYDLMVWSALPAVAVGAVDAVLLARLWVMAVAYTPGRVLGMTPGVEDVTMAVRTRVAPLVLLAAWAWLLRSAWRGGSVPRRAGRPGGSAPRR
ncbi:glycosyltransferase family 39 protein [Knoellia sp. CPCC 206435]|uniref:glycosyltransferase family 39 protein n=1 Tax=Knoellia terrae TaxID=3404797 RepID=UPI003B43214E